MSVHVSAYVWEHSTHKGTELLLMLAIADIAHKNGIAFPSVSTLARFIRMSDRNTQRVLSKLERSGELKIKRNGGPKGTHLFQVVINTTLPLFSDGGDKLTPDKMSPVKLSGDTSGLEGVTKTAKRGDTAMSPEPVEPKENRKERGADRAHTHRPGEDYSPPPEVVEWVNEKGYGPYLNAHVEKFRLAAGVRRRKPYADLDKAFMNCVVDDWGNVRMQAQRAARFPGSAPAQTTTKTCAFCPRPWTSKTNGIATCDAHTDNAMFPERHGARA